MSPESLNSPEEISSESQKDLDWINNNREILWLTATVAFEEIGYGFIAVDLRGQENETSNRFGYHSEDELDAKEEELQKLLQEYDPDREFIAVLWKDGGRSDIYLGSRPIIGWHTDMRSQTQYQEIQSKP